MTSAPLRGWLEVEVSVWAVVDNLAIAHCRDAFRNVKHSALDGCLIAFHEDFDSVQGGVADIVEALLVGRHEVVPMLVLNVASLLIFDHLSELVDGELGGGSLLFLAFTFRRGRRPLLAH